MCWKKYSNHSKTVVEREYILIRTYFAAFYSLECENSLLVKIMYIFGAKQCSITPRLHLRAALCKNLVFRPKAATAKKIFASDLDAISFIDY